MRKISALFVSTFLCLAQNGLKSGIDRSYLDTTCKPCDDFWRYATGAFLDKNPIPPQYGRWGTFQMLRDANQERLKTILEAASSNRAAAGDQRLVGDFYSSCMNTAAADAAGARPLQPLLNRISAIRTRAALAAELAAFEREGGIGPIPIGGQQDRENSDHVIAAVGTGGLSLPERDYYFKDDAASRRIRDEFVQHVTRTMRLAGDSADAASAAGKTVLEFETTLAKARLTNVARRDPYQTFHKMDLARLQQLAPEFDWKAAFRLLEIPESIAINVSEPDFLKTVNQLLRETPLDTWKTWLRWRIANDRSQFLSRGFYDEWFRFDQTVLSGVTQQLPRWKVCVEETDARLGDPLGHLFVDKHFTADARRRMNEMVENLRKALGEELQNATWLEPETRKNAQRKLENFLPLVGYPAKWRDYSRVRLNRTDYLASVEAAALENRRYQLAKIGKNVDRSEMRMTPPTVNAQYSSSNNAITFPAGILQPPFFYMDSDDAVNYGGIGVVIGHEMGHGFDDQGSKSDADGNLKNWWTDQDRRKFEERAGCVTSQFDTIDVGEGLHHNGKLVTGEAMGDLGGLRLAYEAYHRSLGGKEPPVLDGFTGDQRFFLSFARVWGDQVRPEEKLRRLATDSHPLAKYRANATLQNMPEFHRAFGCKLGDPMVRPPAQQCRLW